MKQLAVLIKPASSACDMRCQYCFYHDVSAHRATRSFGNMKEAVMEKIIDQVFVDLEDGDVMTFAFQGGEPTLVGLAYFEAFVAYVKKQSKNVCVNYAIQTNGMSMNVQWCDFFKAHDFLVGLSIDATKALHDANRSDLVGRGTHKRVMKAKAMLDAHGIDYNVLCVLTEQMAQLPQKVFQFLLQENIRYVQFIPCLDELKAAKKSPYALTPESFASFYNALFRLWKRELDRGHYISIKFFDDVAQLLGTGIASACGMLGQCQVQYVVEADGSTYPCDFYVLDAYKMGNLTEETLLEMRKSPRLKAFLAEEPNALNAYCQKCPFLKMCHGGCKRMKNSMYVNASQTACGYRLFLSKNGTQLQQLARFFKG